MIPMMQDMLLKTIPISAGNQWCFLAKKLLVFGEPNFRDIPAGHRTTKIMGCLPLFSTAKIRNHPQYFRTSLYLEK